MNETLHFKFNRFLRIAVALFVTVVSAWAHGEASLRQATAAAINYVIQDSGLPHLPSENSQRTAIQDLTSVPFLGEVFERINASLFPENARFSLKVGTFGNVFCDTERKFILVDLVIFESLTTMGGNRELISAALMAHELGHYFENVLRAQRKMSLRLDIDLAESDREHANVEALACEILRRAGYSDAQIKDGFESLHGNMRRLFWMLLRPDSEDIQAREAAVSLWLR